MFLKIIRKVWTIPKLLYCSIALKMDNGGAPHYRGSNRAMKMLQAQLQKTNSQQAANRKSVERPPVWPPRNNSISSLEPTDSMKNLLPLLRRVQWFSGLIPYDRLEMWSPHQLHVVQ